MIDGPARVAVVMRTRNRAVLLARALDDVLGQGFAAWRLVIVNDGGDRGPVDALVDERRERLAGRATVVHLDSSGGMEAASNRAIRSVETDLVVVHDDDDTWAPDFLAEAVAHLDAHPDTSAVVLPTEIVYETLEGGTVTETGRTPFAVPHDAVTVFDLLLMNRIVPISLVFRRSAYDRLGGFDESLPVTGDWEFNLRLATQERIDYLPGPPRAFWHQRPNAQGDAANTVNHKDEHLRYDRVVRDRAIRAHVARTGGGDLLYLSRYVEEAVRGAEDRIVARITEQLAARRPARGWRARARHALGRLRGR